MKNMHPVTIAVANGGTIDIETDQEHDDPFAYMTCQHLEEEPYVMALRVRDVRALRYVLGDWMSRVGEEKRSEDEAVRQFDLGNYSYLARDMKDEGIDLDHLTRIARLIRKYR